MRRFRTDDSGSIVPFILVLLLIALVGLLAGVFGTVMGAVSDETTQINALFTLLWAAVPLIVFIGLIFWAIVRVQRGSGWQG